MRISYTTIGRNIRTARVQAGLTQEALAERLHISHLHFGRLERGERPISLEILANMCDALGVRIEQLLSGCAVDQDAALGPQGDAKALGEAIAALASGCSPRTLRLMLAVCREIAASEKLPGETARDSLME